MLSEKYFVTKYLKLLAEIRRNWIELNLIPYSHTIYVINENINYEQVRPEYAALLFCLWVLKASEMDLWRNENDVTFNS